MTIVRCNIKQDWHVLNLNETGYTPGRDLKGKLPERVVTGAEEITTQTKLNFRYEHRISALFCVGADGAEYSPIAVFKDVNEPTLSDAVSETRVTELMPANWTCYWRR